MVTTTTETLKNALTALSEPQTKAPPVNIEAWAEWLNLKTHDDIEIRSLIKLAGEFSYAIKYGEQPRWLSILGNSGTGKTHTAETLWLKLHKRFQWHSSQFIPMPIYWPEFVSELKSGDTYERAKDLRKWPILLIDDIGADRDTTGFATDQLNLLLGCRDDKWTIITSNLNLEQLASTEPRIADRIIRKPNLFIELTCKSHSLR